VTGSEGGGTVCLDQTCAGSRSIRGRVGTNQGVTEGESKGSLRVEGHKISSRSLLNWSERGTLHKNCAGITGGRSQKSGIARPTVPHLRGERQKGGSKVAFRGERAEDGKKDPAS